MRAELEQAVRAAAVAANIPETRLLAVVEVESAGQWLEEDGRTPRLLFERHQFYKWLKARAPDRLQAAIDAGLAIPKWSRATQYRDQRTSAERLALIQRARTIDGECANLATSWGVGQTMGFCAAEIGFSSATQMVEWMTVGGLNAQIEAMVREIKRKGLDDELASGKWAAFAAGYNGPGYAENKYDAKLQAAAEKWVGRAGGDESSSALKQSIPPYELKAVQQRLADLGFYKGLIDGLNGPKTIGAIAAFQASASIRVDGIYGPQTKQALADSNAPRVIPTTERITATAKDLRQMGSGTIKAADQVATGAKVLAGLGVCGLGQTSGVVDWAKGTMGQVNAIRPLVDGVGELLHWATGNWPLLAVGAGLAGAYYASQIIRRRVDQFRASANV